MATIQSYRNLLRAARIAFEGDTRMLNGARTAIRRGFRDNSTLPASDPSIEPALKKAEEIASFLKANLVQGIKKGDTYKLRIHDHTERGDNESIKFANKNPRVGGVKCCSER
ncbi:hypothetical protein QBC40DRAFT_281198 [Triangularia verruculosa]|uniref:Mitochondrial zinc maintenance protein 1, mitochondrial n=1 Tax=Triangularia verruculosa TaxID=2587418 RepID=A0AAN6XFX7_9PEZI|nr:hypothetical protein QBC40DRAFT_281198 [Triangularia verruculosa]